MRKIAVLRGLAILAVVLHHSTGWGQTAMFFWAHRFRPVESPNFDQFGSLSYYVLLAIERAAWFCVPAFLVAAGWGMAYAANTARGTVSWPFVWARVRLLVVPYLLWSLAVFLGDALLLGARYGPLEYLRRLAVGDAVDLYYFVPLLAQFVLLSPLVVRWARRRPVLLLLTAAGCQVGWDLVWSGAAEVWVRWAYPWVFCRWAFFFPLGAVVFTHQDRAKALIGRLKWVSVTAAACLWAYSIRDVALLFSSGAWLTLGDHARRPASEVYALAFVLAFLGFDSVRMRVAGALQWLGARSYGVFLLHFTVLTAVSKVLYHVAPWVLGRQVLLQPVLILAGLGLPLACMEAVARSPLRRSYPWLFGAISHPPFRRGSAATR